MHDQTLTIPQHADPIARGLLLSLLAALLGLAVVAPAPPTEASTPIVIIATPALAALPLSARLDAPTAVPTALPSAEPPSEAAAEVVAAPTIAPPPEPSAPTSELPAPDQSAQSATLDPAQPQADTAAPLIASGPQVPQGVQQIHQQPDSTYITVGDSPLRYYVDAEGQVTDVRLPGVDSAPNGADLAVQAPATAQPTTVLVPPASKGRGYLPRAGYRPVRP